MCPETRFRELPPIKPTNPILPDRRQRQPSAGTSSAHCFCGLTSECAPKPGSGNSLNQTNEPYPTRQTVKPTVSREPTSAHCFCGLTSKCAPKPGSGNSLNQTNEPYPTRQTAKAAVSRGVIRFPNYYRIFTINNFDLIPDS